VSGRYEAAGKPPAILWRGNSQLHAINRYTKGEKTASVLLHDALSSRDSYVVTYSQPNANLIEHAIVYGALSSAYSPSALIIPVFLDDIREQGIRTTVAAFLDDAVIRRRLEASPHVARHCPAHAIRGGSADAHTGEHTFQQRFENDLNAALSQVSEPRRPRRGHAPARRLPPSRHWARTLWPRCARAAFPSRRRRRARRPMCFRWH
jgi:hypothetical protein